MSLPVRHDTINMDTLHGNIEFFVIFEEAGWIDYFERLNGFHEEMMLQFSMNLTRTHLEIRILRIDVS